MAFLPRKSLNYHGKLLTPVCISWWVQNYLSCYFLYFSIQTFFFSVCLRCFVTLNSLEKRIEVTVIFLFEVSLSLCLWSKTGDIDRNCRSSAVRRPQPRAPALPSSRLDTGGGGVAVPSSLLWVPPETLGGASAHSFFP